tara:strand:+ start:3152 stop:4909 length:1758 start_codon:yes stop_codon:yes gene_type:complete
VYGPQTPYAQHLHETKYRSEGESFDDYCVRYARVAADDDNHFRHLLDALRYQRILPAGRQQLAVGRPYEITAMNCYVGGLVPDTSEGIMDELKCSMLTLRSGGGCGWDFSTLRPYGDPIRGLGIKAYATGPVSFMGCWDAMCSTVLSAGHRRGAMMGVLRVDHPDIMRFINAKADSNTLTNFNVSVAITDSFIDALHRGSTYPLVFGDRRYGEAHAVDVWARIMERNWDWGEPGVLFIDQINRMNPLDYCETIRATNPCGEQPLPPNGACLLGSLNLIKYLIDPQPISLANSDDYVPTRIDNGYSLDWDLLRLDVATACRAFDNVIDNTRYPLEAQREEAQNKRRMGIGVTAMANALEIMGHSYGSPSYLEWSTKILETIRDTAYHTSVSAVKKKGQFPYFDAKGWLRSGFAKTLPRELRSRIRKEGLRNGLLLSIAPTGTISMCADNVSSGIEPPFALSSRRLVHMPEGQVEVELDDWAFSRGVSGLTAQDIPAKDHIRVLCATQKYVDSSVSKTCNVVGAHPGEEGLHFDEFKELYMMAHEGGAKGCTTFNSNGKRAGILVAKPAEGAACFIDPNTGERSCEE